MITVEPLIDLVCSFLWNIIDIIPQNADILLFFCHAQEKVLTTLSKRIWSAVIIGCATMGIVQSDFVSRLCAGGIAGSAYYLLLFIWDMKE